MRYGTQLATVAIGALLLAAPVAHTGHDKGAEQLLRNTQRAKITHVVAERFPVARSAHVRVAVEIEILPGMHVNANPPTYNWLIPVEVSIGDNQGIGVLHTFYPEAELVKFPYDEKPFAVYTETFVVGLELEVAAGAALGDRTLEVVLNYQACNDEACFAPTKTTFSYPLTVVADGAKSVKSTSPLIGRAPFPKS